MKFTIEGLKNKAKEVVAFSEIMQNRTKLSIDDIMFKYPDGVHIHEIDFVEDADKQYVVFVTKEEQDNFTFGGQVVTDFFKNLLDNDLSLVGELNETLNDSEGLELRFRKVRTKNNRTATVIDVL